MKELTDLFKIIIQKEKKSTPSSKAPDVSFTSRTERERERKVHNDKKNAYNLINKLASHFLHTVSGEIFVRSTFLCRFFSPFFR